MAIDKDYDILEDDGRVSSIPTRDLQALRKAARAGKDGSSKQREMEEQLRLANEDMAFMRAGIDPSSTDAKTAMFYRGYDGPIEAEAIRASAEEVGVLFPASFVPTEELRMHQQMAAASAGLDGFTPPEPSLKEKIAKAPDADSVMKLITDAGIPSTWNRH